MKKFLVVLLTFVTLCPAWARCKDPAEAAQQFLRAVAAGRHREAWSLMSTHSQQFCVVQVANQRHVSLSRAEAMLGRDDPSLRTWWEGVQKTSRAQDWAGKQFTSGNIYGSKGTAFIGGLTGHMEFTCYKGPDGWKFDYPETYHLK
ncbi:MAG TPA: hypothetical protein VGO93_23460 [Candidatus Xenobia bacterium]|jgi:hypothetical protein